MKPVDLPHSSTKTGQAPGAIGWPSALAALSFGWLALVLLYFSDVRTIVYTWYTVGTYAHGLVVYPVSAWLIWRQRQALMLQAPQPYLPAALVLGLLSLIWLLGHLTNMQTLREFAFVASVPMLVWAVLGSAVARTIFFALAMTMFAWPVGEFFVPTMIDYTADFTVAALRLSGVPVYREGNFFVIPTGSWSVVEGCSGIRYLIASVYGGAIFAYLNFRDWRRRLPFMIAAIIVPIVANWLRAYIIVMLGHLSDNRIAAGVDHLVYGWLFFGIVIIALFYVGSRFSDAHGSESKATKIALAPAASGATFAVLTLLAVTLAGIGPGVALALQRVTPVYDGAVIVHLPSSGSDWTAGAPPFSDWESRVETPVFSAQTVYVKSDQTVGLFVAYYRNQQTGAKMLTYASTSLADYSVKGWRTIERNVLPVTSREHSMQIIERRMHSQGQNLISWQWYWAGRQNTAGFWEGKLAEVKGKLAGLGDDAATVVLSAPFKDDPEQARATLRAFLAEMGPAIETSLNDAAGQ